MHVHQRVLQAVQPAQVLAVYGWRCGCQASGCGAWQQAMVTRMNMNCLTVLTAWASALDLCCVYVMGDQYVGRRLHTTPGSWWSWRLLLLYRVAAAMVCWACLPWQLVYHTPYLSNVHTAYLVIACCAPCQHSRVLHGLSRVPLVKAVKCAACSRSCCRFDWWPAAHVTTILVPAPFPHRTRQSIWIIEQGDSSTALMPHALQAIQLSLAN